MGDLIAHKGLKVVIRAGPVSPSYGQYIMLLDPGGFLSEGMAWPDDSFVLSAVLTDRTP